MSNSFHHTPNKARALSDAISILSRPYQRRTDDYARPPSCRVAILTGAAAGFLPAGHAARRYAWDLPGEVVRRSLAGCVLVVGIAVATHLANAQELTRTGQLEKHRLPAIESLTFESDYSAFMAPGVPPDVRRNALRKLWSFAFFNETDGLLAYAGDYTIRRDAHAALAASVLSGQQPE